MYLKRLTIKTLEHLSTSRPLLALINSNHNNQGSLDSISSATVHDPGRIYDLETGKTKDEKPRASLAKMRYVKPLWMTARNLNLKSRAYLNEPAAEFVGTLILVLLGTAVDCQVVLSSNTEVATSPKGVSSDLSYGVDYRIA